MGGCWLAMRWATYIPVLALVGERGHPYVASSAEVLNSANPTCLLRPSGNSTFDGEHTRCGGCQTDHQSCHQRSECRLIPPPISAGCHLARQPAPGRPPSPSPSGGPLPYVLSTETRGEGRHNCNCSRQKVALLGPCDRELDWAALWGKSTPICAASMQRGRSLSCRSRLPRDRSNDLLIVAIARHPPP